MKLRFVPAKFEEIFGKHARTNANALTSDELMTMLKSNRVPKDYAGWFVVILIQIFFEFILYVCFSNMPKYNTMRPSGQVAGLQATQSGRSYTCFARTRTDYCIKTQFKLFMMEPCLSIWQWRKLWPGKKRELAKLNW